MSIMDIIEKFKNQQTVAGTIKNKLIKVQKELSVINTTSLSAMFPPDGAEPNQIITAKNQHIEYLEGEIKKMNRAVYTANKAITDTFQYFKEYEAEMSKEFQKLGNVLHIVAMIEGIAKEIVKVKEEK